MHVLIIEIPRWPQVGPSWPKAPKLIQNGSQNRRFSWYLIDSECVPQSTIFVIFLDRQREDSHSFSRTIAATTTHVSCYKGNRAYTTGFHGLSGQLCLYRFRKVLLGTVRFSVPESPPRDFQVHLNAPKGIEEGCGEERVVKRGNVGEYLNEGPLPFLVNFHKKGGP